MSAEKLEPEPGDVWLLDGQLVLWDGDGWCLWLGEQIVGSGDHFLFNLPDLLSGDPSAWAAALRFAPEVFLLEVGEGEEKRQIIGLPKRFSFRYLMAESSDGRELEADGTLPPEWSVRLNPMGAKGDWKAHDDNDFPTAVRAALESDEK